MYADVVVAAAAGLTYGVDVGGTKIGLGVTVGIGTTIGSRMVEGRDAGLAGLTAGASNSVSASVVSTMPATTNAIASLTGGATVAAAAARGFLLITLRRLPWVTGARKSGPVRAAVGLLAGPAGFHLAAALVAVDRLGEPVQGAGQHAAGGTCTRTGDRTRLPRRSPPGGRRPDVRLGRYGDA